MIPVLLTFTKRSPNQHTVYFELPIFSHKYKYGSDLVSPEPFEPNFLSKQISEKNDRISPRGMR